MMTNKLKQDIELLTKQKMWLQYSFNQCEQIGIKDNSEYSMQEFGEFETLCSRYSRTMDFLVRKFYRSIDAYEFENQGTLIDVVNNAEKRRLIDSVQSIREMKDLRNTIVYEYIDDNLANVFTDVFVASKVLLRLVEVAQTYVKNILET